MLGLASAAAAGAAVLTTASYDSAVLPGWTPAECAAAFKPTFTPAECAEANTAFKPTQARCGYVIIACKEMEGPVAGPRAKPH